MDDSLTTQRPRPGAILETAVYATDLDAAETFYTGFLGLEKISRVGDRHLFCRVGQQVLLIFNPLRTITGGDDPSMPVPPHGATGQGHICFAASAAAIQAWVERLEASGYPIEADFHWPDGARSIYFRDPAGNSLEFAEPRLWFPDE